MIEEGPYNGNTVNTGSQGTLPDQGHCEECEDCSYECKPLPLVASECSGSTVNWKEYHEAENYGEYPNIETSLYLICGDHYDGTGPFYTREYNDAKIVFTADGTDEVTFRLWRQYKPDVPDSYYDAQGCLNLDDGGGGDDGGWKIALIVIGDIIFLLLIIFLV